MNRAILIILLTFWKIVMIFPRKAHLLFANLLGFLFLISGNKRNKYSKINIEMCFPELSQQEQNAIYRKNIISYKNKLNMFKVTSDQIKEFMKLK